MKKNIRITEKALSRIIDNVIKEKEVVVEMKVKDLKNRVNEQLSSYQLTSGDVREIQNALNEYFKMKNTPTKIVVDERWGPSTVEALKKFQKMEKLDVDGIPGPSVYERMVELGIRGNFFERWLSKLGLF
jgi:peptidoglycan hydrolase-like protein with peptidoglycan-binding domain